MSESQSQPRQGSFALRTTDDVNRVEAPVTWKAYLICAFASFGGIFFGYDSGYINGVNGSKLFIHMVEGPDANALTSSHSSLIVSILSAGTFFGAIIAGDVSDMIGRKWTIIIGCLIYTVGVVIQMVTGAGDALAAIVTGRLVAGIGVGFESAIVILYMSEIVSITQPLSFVFNFATNTSYSVLERSEGRSLPDTSSASPLESCWRQLSSMPRRTVLIPALTESQSLFNLPGR